MRKEIKGDLETIYYDVDTYGNKQRETASGEPLHAFICSTVIYEASTVCQALY